MNQLIRLTATWCGPCKMYAPIFTEVAENVADRWEVSVLDIDTDEGREMMIANNIRSVPTTVIMEAGKDPKMIAGAMSQEALLDLLGE